ncbi:hypothetical protein [uncultured Gimesia sp.]|uniref:hypothetical protein n=1 Tax=uncultured Gimesia sp. TaxID=1678688 RepID=UPI0030D78736|tara:strand:+ start:98 stop:916 length:819 start_codon:yes stop_codon:yes gene_type:complete
MKRRTRIWITAFSLMILIPVLHFIYVFCVVYFEHQRANARFYSYREVLLHFNTLNLIESQREPGFESWETGHYAMAPLNRKDQDGRPLYSWRFAEYLTWPVPLPHGLPWTAEEYQYYRESVSLYLFCNEGELETFVFAMEGPDTAFDQTNPTLVKSLPEDLILFADVYQSNTHWMQPGDFTVETLPDEINVPGGLGSEDYPGFFVCFVDGQIWWLNEETPIALVKRFCTITEARKADRKILEPYCREKYQANIENLMWVKQTRSDQNQDSHN